MSKTKYSLSALSFHPSSDLQNSFNISQEKNLQMIQKFKEITTNPSVGFLSCLEDREQIRECQELFQHFSQKRKIKQFIHVGIGGSSLGTEMLIKALQNAETQFIFINNIDPDQIHDDLKKIDLGQSLFYFVSKSGSTAETMAAMAIIINHFEKQGLDQENWKNYFAFATDPSQSQLKDFAQKYDIKKLRIPSAVGGRFSVLTSVAYFPALFASIDINKIFNSALKFKKEILSNGPENPLVPTAELLFSLYQRGVKQTVLMPYSSKLKSLSSWFVQLWAESLGKKNSKEGQQVFAGLTPIASYGATDQHSQMQLFMEGPFDKFLFIIQIKNFQHDFSLKNNFNFSSLKKLAPFSLAQLMTTELQGTLKALELNKRPYLHLSVDTLDENSLVFLILFFESLTALMGEYLNIDPFDQPGVEAGKIFAFEWLAKNSPQSKS